MGVTSRVETVRLSNVQCASQSMDEKKRDKEDTTCCVFLNKNCLLCGLFKHDEFLLMKLTQVSLCAQ